MRWSRNRPRPSRDRAPSRVAVTGARGHRWGALVLAIVLQSLGAGAATADESDQARTLTLAALRDRYADPAGHIAPIDGVDVYYKDEGSGPAILMVHGSVSTLKTFDSVAARLIDRYRVIRYDIPPQGLSGPVSDASAARLQPVDIAAKLLELLGVRSVTALGVSSGGTLCIVLAAERPDLVARLILANTPADPVDASHQRLDPAFEAVQKEAAETHFQSRRFWDVFLDYYAGDPARMTPTIRQQYFDFNRRAPEPHGLDLVAKVADHAKAVQAMAKVTVPTLLVWGARDPLLTPPAARALEAYLVRAQVSTVFLPDVGHYPPLEVPERFADIVRADLESIAPVGK